MRPVTLFAMAAAFVILAALPGPSVAAGLEVRLVGKLPAANYRAASVDTGKVIYIFGGRNETNLTTAVVKYDVSSGKVSDAGFRLPQPRMSACAVLVGDHAFVFGGADGGLELDTILAIDLPDGPVRTLDARLPSPRIGLVAAVSGGMVYLFGGHSNGTKIANVTRFDPGSENISLTGASLPSGRAGMGVATGERGIYLFGGKTDPGASDEVLLYDPAKDNLTVLPERMPYTVYHAPAVVFEGKVLIIGGNAQFPDWNVSKATDTIIEFDPGTGKSKTLPARLPSPRERSSAAVVDGKVLVFGGQEGVSALDDIVACGQAGMDEASGNGTWLIALSMLMLASVAAVAVAARRRR